MIIIDHGKTIYDGSIKGIKQNHNRERIVEVDFNNEYPDLKIKDIRIESNTALKKTFYIDTAEYRIPDIIRAITNNYDVSDLTIREPEIEAIVREIYEKGV